MTEEKALHLLTHTPVFSGANREEVQSLARLGSFLTLRRGDHLFREGEAVTRLYIVQTGSVRIYRLSRGGTRELTLHVDGPRQLVALVAAFQSRATAPGSAQALQTPTELLSLPLHEVRQAVFHSPSLSQAMLGYFARRQSELIGRIDRLVFSELSGRLAAYLLEQAPQPHQLPTNSELAALLGTVPELVSRKLGEFYRLGFIRLERRQVQVIDESELRRLAED
ncbi:Crp/Fnr family transcriptional regulator [Deinococcus fonticola]|uniref:Crp/Fnr family transcriptional regulator n=1 Tax=Deinococcus fonticola TaxID=2528713 RepID=UPI00107508A3|nr:Crp/Fnr family transcriptional regulator [Deinococcus fonticola]